MFNQYFRFSTNELVDVLIKIFLSVIFLCLLCPFKFNISVDIPITLQSLSVLIVAIWFGWKIGTISIFSYLILGVTGVPVFAGYSFGFEKLTGATGGFLLSFLVAGFTIGLLAEKIKFQRPLLNLLLWIFGHFMILVIGGYWLSFFSDDWWSMIKTTLPGAAIKITAGWLLTQLLVQIFKGRKLS